MERAIEMTPPTIEPDKDNTQVEDQPTDISLSPKIKAQIEDHLLSPTETPMGRTGKLKNTTETFCFGYCKLSSRTEEGNLKQQRI